MKSSLLASLAFAAVSVLAFGSSGRAQDAATLTTLYSFAGSADGSDPTTEMILDASGNIYGLAGSLGPNGNGTVFELTPAGTLTTLHAFDGTDGEEPSTPLIRNAEGSFYGTCLNGGPGFTGSLTGNGNIFRLSATGVLTDLHDFTNANGEGSNPLKHVILAADGSLFGATYNGGTVSSDTQSTGNGTIFQLTPGGTLNTLHSFTDSEGMNPNGLVMGPDGNYYGTTFTSGLNGGGCFFSITPTGTFTPAAQFSVAERRGSKPFGCPPCWPMTATFIARPNMAAATGPGAIIQITPAGAVTTIYSFDALDSNQHNVDGFNPRVPLIQAEDGNFYGTASAGGANGDGTVYRVTPSGVFTLLHTFAGPDGSDVEGGLVSAGGGTFYGNTNFGGTNGGLGTVYVLKSGPSITSSTMASGQVGVAFSYQIVASYAPTGYNATGLPAGLGVDASGRISGTPTVAGSFQVELSATNTSGTGTSRAGLDDQRAADPCAGDQLLGDGVGSGGGGL